MISNQKMQEMVEAMDEISNTSQEIGNIIAAINDIASQTNLLAPVSYTHLTLPTIA